MTHWEPTWSLAQRVAGAPPNVRGAAMLAAKLVGADVDARNRVLRRLPPELADGIRDELPPPGLTGKALIAHQEAAIAKTLGERWGGHQWLAAMARQGGRP